MTHREAQKADTQPTAGERGIATARNCAYQVEGDGPLLISIAGLDGTGELFFKQSAALARSFRVVTFRQRDEREFSYDDLADDVADVLAAAAGPSTDTPRATIVAESFGGGIALTFALRYPSMVERLVIINSFSRYRERARINLARWFASWVPFQALWPLRIAASRLGLHIDGVGPADRRRFFDAIRTVSGQAYAQRLRLVAALNLDDRLCEITAPTLLIATKKDLIVRSMREARFMAERIPNACVKILPGAGHACLLGNSVSLADLIAEWKKNDSE